MQYLLSEKEYSDLKKSEEALEDLPTEEELQKFCSYVADNLPIKFWRRKEAKPWGCVITRGPNWYCDECPSRKVCPYPHKRFSK